MLSHNDIISNYQGRIVRGKYTEEEGYDEPEPAGEVVGSQLPWYPGCTWTINFEARYEELL